MHAIVADHDSTQSWNAGAMVVISTNLGVLLMRRWAKGRRGGWGHEGALKLALANEHHACHVLHNTNSWNPHNAPELALATSTPCAVSEINDGVIDS